MRVFVCLLNVHKTIVSQTFMFVCVCSPALHTRLRQSLLRVPLAREHVVYGHALCRGAACEVAGDVLHCANWTVCARARCAHPPPMPSHSNQLAEVVRRELVPGASVRTC